jgi:hypothetical protein
MAMVNPVEDAYRQQRVRQAVVLIGQELAVQAQELQQLAQHTRHRAQQTRVQTYWFRTCASAVRLVRQRVHQDMRDREAQTSCTPAALPAHRVPVRHYVSFCVSEADRWSWQPEAAFVGSSPGNC